MYSAKQFKLSVLNSDDEQVKLTARSSLALHMQKRKVPEALVADGNVFAGFQRSVEGNLMKNSKVNWPRSEWVHLNELCVRENVVLEKRVMDDCYALTFDVDDDVHVSTTTAKTAYTLCKQSHLAKFTAEWKTKESQGRVVRDATQVDHKLSNAYLSNAKLKDVIVSFIVRGRLQLLQCNSLLSLYYPNQYTKRCTLCNHPTETVSHVVNGCTKYQAYYQSRHNIIVDIIAHHIQTRNGSKQILKDTCLTPQLFDSGDASFVTNAVRPDITSINKIDLKCL
jgi:hypothetical protein